MRDFFINALEMLVGVLVVVMAIAVVVFAGIAAFGGGNMGPGAPNGILAGLAILVGGALYIILIGGALYLGLGIYQNTRKTAEVLERMASIR
jgi:hypothetical protein